MMNKKWMNLVVAAALLSTSAYAGKGGAGVRGGGHVVDVDGTPELLDLVSRSHCDWRSGVDVYESIPELKTALEKVSALDWYFGRELKTEIEFLSYCFTGSLAKVSPNDDDTIVTEKQPKTKQVALRSNENVYIDESIYNQMKGRSRAFLIVHEAMHSYLSMETVQRKLKLRSIVNALAKVESGQIGSRKTLHLQMSQNDILFPLTVEKLNRYKPQVEYVTATDEVRRSMVLASQDPELFVNPDIKNFNGYLAEWDQKTLTSLEILSSDIRSILLDGTTDEFELILNQKKFNKIEPEVIALSILSDLSEEKRAILMNSPRLSGVTSRTFEWLKNSKIEKGDYRILADRNFQKLSASKPEETWVPLTSLTPRKLGRAEAVLPEKLQALAELAASLAKMKAWGELNIILLENEAFYDSMGLKSQLRSIEAMSPFVPSEKALALSVVSQIRDGLIQAWLNSVRVVIADDEIYAEFYSKVKLDAPVGIVNGSSNRTVQ